MNIIKIIISYLLGLIFIHLLLIPGSFFQIGPMFLIMGCSLDENMSELIWIYIVGGLITYLFYYLFTSKKIDKLFWFCAIVVGMIIILEYSTSTYYIVNNFSSNFMRYIDNLYKVYYSINGTFSFVLLYILSQVSVLLLYFLISYFRKLLKKKFSKNTDV